MHRGELGDARRRGARAGDVGDTPDALALGAEGERDLDAVGGQRAAGTVRPFHDDHGAGNIVDAELGELVGGGHPVEVDMDERQICGRS